ncbi:MAG: riboflavin kinase, partial [Pseudomonadota bacterium]
MDIVRSWRETPPDLKGAVLAIGNFDGVHRGHQAVLGVAKAIAAAEGRKVGAVIFEPHPREFFAPGRPFFRLTPEPVKLELLEALGLDVVFVLPFDRALAGITADAFATEVLGDAFGVRHVVVGYDFCYGKGRAGSVSHLAAMGEKLGYGVDVVEPVGLETEIVFSSSAIRDHLAKGEVRAAADQLGYWWRARGAVTHGAGKGQGLGFPTVNFKLLPGQDVSHGIYAMRVHHGG